MSPRSRCTGSRWQRRVGFNFFPLRSAPAAGRLCGRKFLLTGGRLSWIATRLSFDLVLDPEAPFGPESQGRRRTRREALDRRLGRPYPPLTTKRVVKGPRNSQRRAHPSSLRPELRPGKPLGLTRARALHFGRPLGPCVCADSAVHGTRDWSKANGDRVFDGQSAKRLVIDLHAQAEAG